MKRLIIRMFVHTSLIAIAFLLQLFSCEIANAAIMGGTDVTPTEYDVTILKIEFQNSGGSWVTYFDGSSVVDIRSVGPNTQVSPIGSGRLPAATYTTIRVTFSETFGLTGAGIDGPFRGRTNTGNPSTGNNPPYTRVGIASVDANPATTQQVPTPLGGAYEALMNANGITTVAAGLQYEGAVNFTVTASGTMPTIDIRFNVNNGMEVRVTGPVTGFVIPAPPSVTVVVS